MRTHLLQGDAKAARFVELHEDGFDTPEDALPLVGTRIAKLPRPFDALVLGMGEDGHTASFFPGGDRLTIATDPLTRNLVLPMNAPGAGEPRVTLTLPVVLDTRHLYLHIEGAKKRALLDAAKHDGDYPIGSVLRNAQSLDVYWCD